MTGIDAEPRHLLRVKTGTYNEYESITARDPFTLYFAYDTQQLFRGDKEYSKSVELVNSLPEMGIFGKLYAVVGEESTELYTWNKASGSYTKISIDMPEGGSGGAPKIQKYTINAAEYYDKTSEPIISFSGREVAEGLFDITLTVSIKLVDDVFDNPAPVFANQPITYEGDIMSTVVYADLKEIVLCLEGEGENEDTGEIELVEFYINASIIVRMFNVYLNPSIKFEINEGQLSAMISVRYEGIDNDTTREIRATVEDFNEMIKAATLYYVPYEMGDETIAEVSI